MTRNSEDEQHGEEAGRAEEEERPAADAVDVEEGVRFEDELDDPHRDRPEHRRRLLADARPLKDALRREALSEARAPLRRERPPRVGRHGCEARIGGEHVGLVHKVEQPGEVRLVLGVAPQRDEQRAGVEQLRHAEGDGVGALIARASR